MTTTGELTFAEFRKANVTRCLRWHPAGIESWSPSDWLTAVTGELGELASLLKMRNRERDGLPGNKFSPSDKQVADEIADVLTYLDLLAAALGVDLGPAAASKFNEVSERVGFPDRLCAVDQPAEPESWRNASTELPTHIHSVLVWVTKSPNHFTADGGFADVGIYNDTEKRWQISDGGDDVVVEVSHWMPVPDRRENQPDKREN